MENKIDLIEEIRRISLETKYSPMLLEKDYHLTRILHKLSEEKIKNLVFKGGTCLNKCYLGFYRLSEDLDFVFNQDVKKFSKTQIRKRVNKLRREFFKILKELGLEVDKKFGKGWKMLTSKKEPKIVGLEIIASYNSILDNSKQKIKLETSFRNKLRKNTKKKKIHHEFINPLGEPILKEGVEIEVIDLVENFAEKFRALMTRKSVAIRDVFDIYYIFKNNFLDFNEKVMSLVLQKLNESVKKKFKKEDLISFIGNLDQKTDNLDKEEISAVLKSNEEIIIEDMIKLIKHEVLNNN